MESEIDQLYVHLHKSRYDNIPNLHSRGHEHNLAPKSAFLVKLLGSRWVYVKSKIVPTEQNFS